MRSGRREGGPRQYRVRPLFRDGRPQAFNWVIHPEGFDGTPLLDLGRLQGWTLKPARFKH